MKANPSKPVPVAILTRVSTDNQATSRQLHELRQVAESKGWQVVEEIEERAVSGRADEEERHGLTAALELARAGKVRRILVHEVSRLARRNSIVHRFVEELDGLGVSLYWHAQGIETLLPNGRRNPAAGVMLALLAEMARAEVDNLRERILSGLEQARRNGKRLGRPQGSVIPHEVFLAKHRDVVKLLRSGQSVRHAAAIAGKAPSTVQRVARAMRGA